MKANQKELDRLEDLKEEARTLAHKILERAGWTYVCDTPGSFWLWEQKIKGKTYRVDESLALAMVIRS